MSVFSNLFSKLNLVDVAAKAESAVAEIAKLKGALETVQAKLAEVDALKTKLETFITEHKNMEVCNQNIVKDLQQDILNAKNLAETTAELLEKKIDTSK